MPKKSNIWLLLIFVLTISSAAAGFVLTVIMVHGILGEMQPTGFGMIKEGGPAPEQSSVHSYPNETLLDAVRDFAYCVERQREAGAKLEYPLFIAGEPSAYWRSVLEAIEREEAKQSTLKSESAAKDKLAAASDKWKSAKTEGKANGQAKGGG